MAPPELLGTQQPSLYQNSRHAKSISGRTDKSKLESKNKTYVLKNLLAGEARRAYARLGLRRRLEPAWPFSAALRLLGFGLAGLCDAALDIKECRSRRWEEELLLLRLLLLDLHEVSAFFAFFAMLPS
jgi:hypothetical protein